MVMSEEQPWAEFERFQFQMPRECVEACSHSGACDSDVEHWANLLDLSSIPADDIREVLREYGAWEEDDLKNDEDNRHRIIWIAASNIQEQWAMGEE